MAYKAKLLTQGGISVKKSGQNDIVVALAGNPNVGKSTVFNSLTGMKQHTGNWAGKTVSNAQGVTVHNGISYILVDLPGTYSLMANSKEEEAARDFICFSKADCVVVVCDATCVERNLNLVLQTLEITQNIVVCINLTDEAERKNIFVSIEKLSENLGLPVVATSARSGKGLSELMDKIAEVTQHKNEYKPINIRYINPIEEACLLVENSLAEVDFGELPKRFAALRLLEGDRCFLESLKKYKAQDILENPTYYNIKSELIKAQNSLLEQGINKENINDKIVSCLVLTAEGCCDEVVSCSHCTINQRDRKLDKFLTSRLTGIPIMLLLLVFIFWLTITVANYPSQLLSTALFWVQDRFSEFFVWINAPSWVNGILVEGIYRTLAWVVAVMLPPMVIFFPLFTILEDFGYLPRVAFNLDSKFKKANACGKQSLTMCMWCLILFIKSPHNFH